MIPARSNDYLGTLVHELRSLPTEAEWVEFKENPSTLAALLDAMLLVHAPGAITN
jgi:hypothetical protein